MDIETTSVVRAVNQRLRLLRENPVPASDPARLRTGPFPAHVLPQPIRDYVTSTAINLHVPPELVALPLLAIAGGTIGNQVRFQVGPGWLEHPALWIALVAPIGTGKSPAIRAARQPADFLQDKLLQTPTDRPDHLVTTDVTFDALLDLLKHSAGVTIIRDELVGIVRAMNRRGGDDRQRYLALWSSEAILVARKGKSSTWLPDPVVSIVGGIQPILFHRLRSRDHDGFVERFIPIFVLGQHRFWSENEPTGKPTSDITPTAEILRALRSIGRPPEQIIVTRTPEAGKIWQTWFNDNVERVRVASDNFAGFYNKLPGQVARLALILHALEHPDAIETPISEQTMQHAVQLGEFVRSHVHRVLLLLGDANPPRVPKPTLGQRILRALAESTTPEGWTTRTELLIATARPETQQFDETMAKLIDTAQVERPIRRHEGRGKNITVFRHKVTS